MGSRRSGPSGPGRSAWPGLPGALFSWPREDADARILAQTGCGGRGGVVWRCGSCHLVLGVAGSDATEVVLRAGAGAEALRNL